MRPPRVRMVSKRSYRPVIKLMGVNLVPGVPDQAVLGEIETQVQSETQLYHAKIAGEVGGPDA